MAAEQRTEGVPSDGETGSSDAPGPGDSDGQSGSEDDSVNEAKSDKDEQLTEREQLVHWWCRKQLSRCLKKLTAFPEATPFLEPLPWEQLGLMDYREVVEEPMDLRTIGELIESGEYEDDDGLIDPDLFWDDVTLIWDNCALYYEGDEDAEPFRMAEKMRAEAEHLEEEFWSELERFEDSIQDVDNKLGQVAAVADVAAGHMEDRLREGAVIAEDLLQRLGGWWRSGADPQLNTDAWQPPNVELVQVDDRHIVRVVNDAAVGKGKVFLKLTKAAPSRKVDREAFAADFVGALSKALEVVEEEVEINWDQVFRQFEYVSAGGAGEATASGGRDATDPDQLQITYRIRLSSPEELKETIDAFSVRTMRATLTQALGDRAKVVDLEPLALSKASRRPLRDHFFDLVLDRCSYDASADLTDIEDELTEALKSLLPAIKQLDADEDTQFKAALAKFPGAGEKVALNRLTGPKLTGSSRAGSTRSCRRSVASSSGKHHGDSGRSSAKDSPHGSAPPTPRKTSGPPGSADSRQDEPRRSSGLSGSRRGSENSRRASSELPSVNLPRGNRRSAHGADGDGSEGSSKLAKHKDQMPSKVQKRLTQFMSSSSSEEDAVGHSASQAQAPDVNKLKAIMRQRSVNTRRTSDGSAAVGK
eukprot:TRINITY_DN25994_c0_g1_i1.p1 TRINITY_DN25994_c0_g1~~TRINITY_DN25994_c0_g1_i1.p1  ORF type:complete len:646 (-),score=180.83 TRINITY_DN25994_c0_g1_i1:151-2088(-)